MMLTVAGSMCTLNAPAGMHVDIEVSLRDCRLKQHACLPHLALLVCMQHGLRLGLPRPAGLSQSLRLSLGC